jgi:V8-like Glu-specific endopeptidase
MSNYLSVDRIHRLEDAILSGGLNTDDARSALLANINPGYVAMLPRRSTTLDQIASDLNAMNGVPYLMGYEVPLKIWLENAVHRLRRSLRPEQTLFQETLNEVEVKSEAVIQETSGTMPPPPPPAGLEEIIHQDDLLAYGWLQGAVSIGSSVARLVVPRFDNGQVKINPGSAQPIQSKGTGWLIGKEYVITNHHVINARSEGEPLASESDLKKQATSTAVQFDFDGVGVDVIATEVESLAAWVAWNATPALDYAILKLKEPSPRDPLTLAPQALLEAAGDTQPVNIIQHPGGNPKALGIRNNLISSLEEWELRYFTDTMRGSSGSPVCNDWWQVIALHRATKYVHKNLNFQGKPTAYVNRGVRIDRIIAHLQDRHPALWTAIGANVV